MKELKLSWSVMFIVFIVALGAFFLWLYWLVASWLVDSVIGLHNMEGFALKVIIVLAIMGVWKALEGLGNLRTKAER